MHHLCFFFLLSVGRLKMMGSDVFCVFVSIVRRAVMNDDGVMTSITEGIATLSTDARVVEEESAAKFLQEFTACLSNPDNMLL